MTHDPAPSPRAGRRPQSAIGLVLLGLPIFAILVVLAVLAFSGNGANAPSEPIIALGFVAPFVGGLPVFRSSMSPLLKGLVFGAYYIACAIGMFIVGWVALGLFGLAK